MLLLAAFAVLLASFVDGLRLRTCLGDCCAVVEADCCSTASSDAHAPCCDHHCCGTTAESPADDDDPERSPDETDPTCSPGCCATITFDVELAPSDAGCELPPLPPPAMWMTGWPTARSAPAVPVPWPIQRGPPRVDRRTELRACTVLLI